jgi:molybdate transport system substrate-binding protein
MRAIRLLLTPALLAALSAGGAGAAELKVVSAGAMRGALEELAPAFEKSSGHKLKVDYATAGGVEKKIADDDEIDVAILTQPRITKLVQAAKIVSGTTKTLARAEIGLAVKQGAPKPDIGSVEAFKKTLLNAKSVAYVDPASGGTSGIHLAQTIEKLGIAGELKAKTKLVSASAGQTSPRVAEVVARGEAELGMQPISELKEVAGADVVGPLPAELQSPETVYVAGSPMISEQPVAARQLIDFLGGEKAKEVYLARGLQPG